MAHTVTRAMLRGKPLEEFCKKANVDREFCLCYCFGLTDDSYSYRECKKCDAYFLNSSGLWKKGYCPHCSRETCQDHGFCAECGARVECDA